MLHLETPPAIMHNCQYLRLHSINSSLVAFSIQARLLVVSELCQDVHQLCPDIYHLCPDIYHPCPDIYHLCPESFHLCPDFYHLCPDFYHLCPDFYHLCPDSFHLCSDFYHLCPDFYHLCPDSFHLCGGVYRVSPVSSVQRKAAASGEAGVPGRREQLCQAITGPATAGEVCVQQTPRTGEHPTVGGSEWSCTDQHAVICDMK